MKKKFFNRTNRRTRGNSIVHPTRCFRAEKDILCTSVIFFVEGFFRSVNTDHTFDYDECSNVHGFRILGEGFDCWSIVVVNKIKFCAFLFNFSDHIVSLE